MCGESACDIGLEALIWAHARLHADTVFSVAYVSGVYVVHERIERLEITPRSEILQ